MVAVETVQEEAIASMMYSVWNQSAGAYDYFESPAQQASLNVEKPTHLVSRTLGSTIDQAAWPLPGDAKRVGSGEDAIGRVASIKGAALGDDFMDGSAVKLGLLAASAILIWKYATKSRRRSR